MAQRKKANKGNAEEQTASLSASGEGRENPECKCTWEAGGHLNTALLVTPALDQRIKNNHNSSKQTNREK
jgi:hypothetical protein